MEKSRIRKNIKSNAKRMLQGNTGTAILILLIEAAVIFGLFSLCHAAIQTLGLGTAQQISDTEAYYEGGYAAYAYELPFDWVSYAASMGISLLLMFIAIPLSFGALEWFISLSEGKKRPLSAAFDWFSTAKLYWKSIGFSINVGLRTFFFYMLPVLLMETGLFALLTFSEKEQNSMRMTAYILLFLGGLVLLAVASILLSIWIQRYSLTAYLCIRFPQEKGNKLIRESIKLMKGHRGELFVFELSFLPWMLLIPVTVGLILFWLLPYMTASTIIFFNYVYDVGKDTGIGDMAAFPPYQPKEEPHVFEKETGFGELFVRRPAELPVDNTRYATANFQKPELNEKKNDDNTDSEEL